MKHLLSNDFCEMTLNLHIQHTMHFYDIFFMLKEAQ